MKRNPTDGKTQTVREPRSEVCGRRKRNQLFRTNSGDLAGMVGNDSGVQKKLEITREKRVICGRRKGCGRAAEKSLHGG